MKQYTLTDRNREMRIEVVHSRRKTIEFSVSQTGKIKLKVPISMTDKEMIRFCNEHLEHLFTTFEKAKEQGMIQEKSIQEQYADIYYDGAKIPLDDGKLSIQIVKEGNAEQAKVKYQVTEDGDRKLLIKTLSTDPEFIRDGVVSWLREYARYHLTRKAQAYAKQMDVVFNRIAIKEQKTRWGSCSSKRNLNFNWKIVLMPEFMQDYIVVHELAHLKEMNHSANFWREVEKMLPQYKEAVWWQKKHQKEFSKY